MLPLTLNPLSWFITLREKILALIAILLIGFAAGWHVHTVVDHALDYHSKTVQLERAQKAPAAISKFTQDLRKTHVETTPCYGTVIPDDVAKLLR